jgi:hypothetical protein
MLDGPPPSIRPSVDKNPLKYVVGPPVCVSVREFLTAREAGAISFGLIRQIWWVRNSRPIVVRRLQYHQSSEESRGGLHVAQGDDASAPVVRDPSELRESKMWRVIIVMPSHLLT